jgi:hypothetical protein
MAETFLSEPSNAFTRIRDAVAALPIESAVLDRKASFCGRKPARRSFAVRGPSCLRPALNRGGAVPLVTQTDQVQRFFWTTRIQNISPRRVLMKFISR